MTAESFRKSHRGWLPLSRLAEDEICQHVVVPLSSDGIAKCRQLGRHVHEVLVMIRG